MTHAKLVVDMPEMQPTPTKDIINRATYAVFAQFNDGAQHWYRITKLVGKTTIWPDKSMTWMTGIEARWVGVELYKEYEDALSKVLFYKQAA